MFGANIVSSSFTSLFQNYCKFGGFTNQLMDLASQIVLFLISFRYTSGSSFQSLYYLLAVWLPVLALLVLAAFAPGDTFIVGKNAVCIKNFSDPNPLWIAIEIVRIFLASMTLSLSILVLVSALQNADRNIPKAKVRSFLRLFAIVIFDDILMFASGIINIIFSLQKHRDDLSSTIVVYVMGFAHTIFTPTFFLLSYSGVRKMIGVLTSKATGSETPHTVVATRVYESPTTARKDDFPSPQRLTRTSSANERLASINSPGPSTPLLLRSSFPKVLEN
jgi:hypothetical protein